MKICISGAGDFTNDLGEVTSFIVVTTDSGFSEQLDVGRDACAFIKKLLTEQPAAPRRPAQKRAAKSRAYDTMPKGASFPQPIDDTESEFVDDEDTL